MAYLNNTLILTDIYLMLRMLVIILIVTVTKSFTWFVW